MTEQPGHLNAPDLVEECCESVEQDEFDFLNSEYGSRYFDAPTHVSVNAVLCVLRKRGLLTEQALELLADK